MRNFSHKVFHRPGRSAASDRRRQPKVVVRQKYPCDINALQKQPFVYPQARIAAIHRRIRTVRIRVIPKAAELLTPTAPEPVGERRGRACGERRPRLLHRRSAGDFSRGYPPICPEESSCRRPPGRLRRRRRGAAKPPSHASGRAPDRPDAAAADSRLALGRARRAAPPGAGAVRGRSPPPVDEAAVKAGMLAEAAPPRDIADALAELKARRVAAPHARPAGARRRPGAGLRRPALRQARATSPRRGRSSPRCAAGATSSCPPPSSSRTAAPVWRHVGRAQLDHAAVQRRLPRRLPRRARAPALLATVGAYRLEDGGAQLFSRVDGDIFTVIGLPLLELLGFLRTRGVCRE